MIRLTGGIMGRVGNRCDYVPRKGSRIHWIRRLAIKGRPTACMLTLAGLVTALAWATSLDQRDPDCRPETRHLSAHRPGNRRLTARRAPSIMARHYSFRARRYGNVR